MNKCFFTIKKIKYVDYKDSHILKKFLNPSGKILPRTRTNLTKKFQKKVENAIKKARFMGILPYIED